MPSSGASRRPPATWPEAMRPEELLPGVGRRRALRIRTRWKVSLEGGTAMRWKVISGSWRWEMLARTGGDVLGHRAVAGPHQYPCLLSPSPHPNCMQLPASTMEGTPLRLPMATRGTRTPMNPDSELLTRGTRGTRGQGGQGLR